MGSATDIAHGKYLIDRGPEKIWRWDSPTGIIRANRRAQLIFEAAQIKKTDLVLELGCGTGLFTDKIQVLSGANVTGIDVSKELLEVARKKNNTITFEINNAEELSYNNNSFDVVIGSSVLHHLNITNSLLEIFRVIKPGGRIAFAEPNMINPHILLQKNIPYLKKIAGDTPDETAINRWRFKKQLEQSGFTNVQIVPYDFLYPATPKILIGMVSLIGSVIEKLPIVKEIAGSVLISAQKKQLQ